MKIAKLSILLFPLFTLMPQLSTAQQMRTMSFDASTSIMLQEFQTMLVTEDDIVKVELRMGRDEATPGVDRLEKGDVILMMNGNRIKDIEGLRELYDGLEKGSDIKIGVRRGEERFILSAIKGNVPEGASRMMMTFDSDSEDGEQPVIVPSLGILLTNSDGDVLISRVIPPMIAEDLKTLELEGYKIALFNNEKPESATGLKDKIEALAIGDSMSFTIEKDGEETSLNFTKKAPKGNFSINSDHN